MTLLTILKIIAAIGTILTGLYALIRPKAIEGFTGLDVPGPRGISEVRAIFGGLFIGAGAAPYLLSNPIAYQVLGIMYLAIAVVRAGSIILDKSFVQSNITSLVIEIVLGIILIL